MMLTLFALTVHAHAHCAAISVMQFPNRECMPAQEADGSITSQTTVQSPGNCYHTERNGVHIGL